MNFPVNHSNSGKLSVVQTFDKNVLSIIPMSSASSLNTWGFVMLDLQREVISRGISDVTALGVVSLTIGELATETMVCGSRI